MSPECEKLDAFLEGELNGEQAVGFVLHMPGCKHCQTELAQRATLRELGAAYFARHPESAEQAPGLLQSLARIKAGMRHWGRYVVPACLAGCLLLILLTVPRAISFLHAREADVWLAARPRLLEARTSYPPSDKYRPLASKTLGESASPGALPPLAVQAALEDRKNFAALAAVYLSEPGTTSARRALEVLNQAGHSPESDNDRAVAQFARGDLREALRLLEAVLQHNPQHPQALWNRALVLHGLGLDALAAQSFEKVAALKEPGWSEEASERGQALADELAKRYQGWVAARDAGKEMIRSGVLPPPELIRGHPGIVRLHFYDAVRTRTSASQVSSLRPVAQELDRIAGGNALERYIQYIERRDFKKRVPLAKKYGQMIEPSLTSSEVLAFPNARQAFEPSPKRAPLSPDQVSMLLEEFRMSGEHDIYAGALVYAGRVRAENLSALDEWANIIQDPWFIALAKHERARADMSGGKPQISQVQLEAALRDCRDGRVEYRCLGIVVSLFDGARVLGQYDNAEKLAANCWQSARVAAEWEREVQCIQGLAQVSRLRGDLALANAYFDEARERSPDEREQVRYFHQSRAALALRELQFVRARREIDEALNTGLPLTTPVGVYTLVDISRVIPSPDDEANLERALSAVPPGARLVAMSIRGRYALEHDPERGRELLLRVIEEVNATGLTEENTDDLRARAYSYSALILDAGKAGAYDRALELFAQEIGMVAPRQCVAAVTEDNERQLIVVRGVAGRTIGYYQGKREQWLPEVLTGVVPEEALRALRGCERVDAIARAPLVGRAGLLPPDLAWSYRVRGGAAPRPPTGRSLHLIISGVAMSPERLKELSPVKRWRPSGAEELSGENATLSNVLEAMENATEIVILAHGVVYSDSAALILAPDANGEDELKAEEVRRHRLRNAPFVVLAACRAALPAHILYAPVSLPSAFLQAGARGVIAATVDITDQEAEIFIEGIRARIRAGNSPAVALRDERQKWKLERSAVQWLDSVLLFE